MPIRFAADQDAIGIASILNATLATTAIEWTDTPKSEDEIRRWLGVHEVALVAEEAVGVVGVAAYGWFRDVVKWPG
jgi:L-amino acid N-acyltransferase YncA